LSARPASASTLYTTNGGFATWNDSVTSDSGSFSSGDVTGAGQGHFGFRGTAPTNGSTASVNLAGSGTLVVTRKAGDNVQVAPVLNVTPSGLTIFDSQVTVQVSPTGTGGASGPAFGLDIFGDGGGTNVASLVVDGTTGNIYDSVGASTFLLSDGSAGAPAVNTGSAVTFAIDASYLGGTVSLNYLVNGISVDTESISSSSFYAAELFGGTGYAAGTDPASQVGTFSNYLVTETAVPEPGSLAVLGLGSVLFAFRRNRRVASV
jgi:hypothetical protein